MILEPYGHPPNLTSPGDENPFGYRGAYTAGIQGAGVICGGPNQDGGGYYDAEDGRNTSHPLSEQLQNPCGGGGTSAAERGKNAAVRSGPAVATTIEFAGDIDADLIVVGSSASAGVVSRLLGSFPLDLVQRADRQVMVITEPGGG